MKNLANAKELIFEMRDKPKLRVLEICFTSYADSILPIHQE